MVFESRAGRGGKEEEEEKKEEEEGVAPLLKPRDPYLAVPGRWGNN